MSASDDIFQYFEYDLSEAPAIDTTGSLPSFAPSIYAYGRSIPDRRAWSSTPMRAADSSEHSVATQFMSMLEHDCSRAFVNSGLADTPGSYYSCISWYPEGMYIYLFNPGSKKLYVVRKKG